MPNLDYKEKLLGVIHTDGKPNIIVSHVTIRQSIFFLHLKLVAIEILEALAIIVFYTLFIQAPLKQQISQNIMIVNIPLFVSLVILKLSITIFVILQWLNEYYEIKPEVVVFKKGFIFKQEKRFLLKHIGAVTLEQGIFGRAFNFGTLKLFNWTSEKEEYLYLIHNPEKYQKILEDLTPEADEEKDTIRKGILS
jgi:uncharacterized membrane protein YdbT with pleckstrin-like domain